MVGRWAKNVVKYGPLRHVYSRCIATQEEANGFLEGYLPLYNRRFAVPPARVADLHRLRPASGDLDSDPVHQDHPVPPSPEHPWRARLLPERKPQVAAGPT